MGFVLLVLLVGGFAWQWSDFITDPIANSTTKQVIEIKPGSSAKKVAHLLQEKGVLNSPKLFSWYLRYLGKHTQLQAGEFEIDPQWSVERLIDKLIAGQVVLYPVALIAGQTIQENLQMIHSLPKIRKELDINDIAGLQSLFAIESKIDRKYPYANLEGWLLPETYHYKSGDSDKQIVLRAYQAMKTKLDQAWSTRDKGLPFKTPYEALIMASIVEKETGVAAERPQIAGVFMRRIKRGMRLQTDPTVIYGIGHSYDGNIRKRDLLSMTAYNTYRINGLPPTPIALPSKEAIDAVMHPEKTKALYFVAKGGGEHYFSETLIEHNQAVNKYLLNR
ncbi:MAG: endolytic transglycosylase MltG [Pseudomonadota bacterium]